jgi:hypothetical protein
MSIEAIFFFQLCNPFRGLNLGDMNRDLKVILEKLLGVSIS